MDSRTAILNSVKDALRDLDASNMVEPELPLIWEVKGLAPQELADTFAQNLKSVAGEAFLCDSLNDAAQKIADALKQIAESNGKNAPHLLGVYPNELTQQIANQLPQDLWKILNTPEEPKVDPKDYEPMTASLIAPLALLADTGSCVAEGRSAFERLLFYLSPACLVIARASQLRENLPHAWSEISAKLTPEQHGEIAIITGPSRTADIEKKLVLGVHGPQKLLVFIIMNE